MLAPLLALAMLQSQDGSAGHLYNTCQSAIRMIESPNPDPRDFPGGNFCIGYVEGFVDGSGTVRRGACIPEDANAEHVIRAYVAYLIKHPDEKQWERRIVILLALSDAYPCSTGK